MTRKIIGTAPALGGPWYSAWALDYENTPDDSVDLRRIVVWATIEQTDEGDDDDDTYVVGLDIAHPEENDGELYWSKDGIFLRYLHGEELKDPKVTAELAAWALDEKTKWRAERNRPAVRK